MVRNQGFPSLVHNPDQHTTKVEPGGRILLPAQAASTSVNLKNMGIYTVTSSSGDGNNNYGLDDPSPGCELTIAGFRKLARRSIARIRRPLPRARMSVLTTARKTF